MRGGSFTPGAAVVARHAKASAPKHGDAGKPKAKAKAQKKLYTPETAAQANAFMGRENLLNHAVRAGVINQDMRDYYRAAYDSDPQGTKAFLQKLGLSDQLPAEATQAAPAKSSRVVALG